MGGFFKQVVEEMKQAPFTLLLLTVLVLYTYNTHSAHATRDELHGHMEADLASQGEIKKQVDRLVVLQLGATLRELRGAWCRADNATRKHLQGSIDNYQQEYYVVTGHRYDSPDCSEVVIK